MIRLTYRILGCDQKALMDIWEQALNTDLPLLYIDAIDKTPFLSDDAEIYEWLTKIVDTSKYNKA